MSLFNKHLNQLSVDDAAYLRENASEILLQVTHVMDCECYTVDGRQHLRELSIFDLKKNKVETFQVCHLKQQIPQSSTVRYQISNVHGLRVQRTPKSGFVEEYELITLLQRRFAEESNLFVAYKGGNIEKDLLEYTFDNIPSLNLELFGCKKYERMLDRFDLSVRKCKYHVKHVKCHCSRYEVLVFGFFVLLMTKKYDPVYYMNMYYTL